MKNKTIKDPFGFVSAINTNKLNDPKILKTLEEMFKDKPIKDTEKTPEIFKKLLEKSPHNVCDGCGETIKPDQWSENNFTLCIDCG